MTVDVVGDVMKQFHFVLEVVTLNVKEKALNDVQEVLSSLVEIGILCSVRLIL